MSEIKLNKQQLAAVEAPPDKPIIVVASPGSGKTAVLTLRVAHLISEYDAEPSEVVVTTFTRRAADEMKERLQPLIGSAATRLQIGTIHSVCLRILREEGLAKEVISDYERKKIIREELGYRRLNWDVGWRYPLGWITKAKAALVGPREAQDWLFEKLVNLSVNRWQAMDLSQKLARVYRMYEQEKRYLCVVKGTKILCPVGRSKSSRFFKREVPIEKIRPGHLVVSAIGKGSLGRRRVRDVRRSVQNGRFVELELASGRKLKMTASHVVFARADKETERIGRNFVYLENRGNDWRIGWSKNPFSRKYPYSDALVVLGQFDDQVEALFHEDLWSARYGLPQQQFVGSNQRVGQEWLDRLFRELDTAEAAQALARDYGIDLSLPNRVRYADSQARHQRQNVFFELAWRAGQHQVTLWTRGSALADSLESIGMSCARFKSGHQAGGFRLSKVGSDYDGLLELARNIASRIGARLVCRAGFGRGFQMVSAGTLCKGMLVPVAGEDGRVQLDRVVSVRTSIETLETYDLEVEGAANFVADGVVVHNSKMDFADMLMWVAQRLFNDDRFRSRWQRRAQYVLVDEVQDTGSLPYSILRTLAAPESRFFAVGDPDQSLFTWNGADPEHNIFGFKEFFPEGLVLPLEINYRSTRVIVATANKAIAENYEGASVARLTYKKTLKPRPGAPEGLPVVIQGYADVAEEATGIAVAIQGMLQNGHQPQDIFVAYRVNSQSRAIEDELLRHRIPYVIQGGLGFYDRKVVKDMLAYLSLVHDENDDEAFQRVANIATADFFRPTRGFGSRWMQECMALARGYKSSMWEAMLRMQPRQARWQKEAIDDLVNMVQTIREQSAGDPRKALMLTREQCYEPYLLRAEGVDESTAQEEGLFDDLDELYYAASQFKGVKEFLDHVEMIRRMQAQRDKQKVNAVVLTTIHKIKGLERPVVFGIGLAENILPHKYALSGSPDQDKLPVENLSGVHDERCAVFVLVSRAKEELHLSYPLEYRNQPVLPSRFLYEMELLVEHKQQEEEIEAPDGRFSLAKVDK